MTPAKLNELIEELELWSNNCGGCETCSQMFGNQSEPTYSKEEIYELATELRKAWQQIEFGDVNGKGTL